MDHGFQLESGYMDGSSAESTRSNSKVPSDLENGADSLEFNCFVSSKNVWIEPPVSQPI